jgi:hypothetical protein
MTVSILREAAHEMRADGFPVEDDFILAVADWLDGAANYAEAREGEQWIDLDGDPIAAEDTHAIGSALAVARAYLRSPS